MATRNQGFAGREGRGVFSASRLPAAAIKKGRAMADYDLVIRNGTVATASDTTQCDIAIKDGVIATLGRGLAAGVREIEASGRLVVARAIDSHCHIEQRSSAGIICADDFYSATV